MTDPICRPETIDAPQWATRCDPEAARDGWRIAGEGTGLTRFVWDNAHFEGLPAIEGHDGPWRYGLDNVNCPVPGSIRWVGEYDPGPYLSKGLCFQMAVNVGGGIARLFIDGELVAGTQTEAWAEANGLAGTDPRIWPIVGRVVYAGANMEFVEIFTSTLDISADRPVRIVFEYAIADGFNSFGAKNFKDDVGQEQGADVNYAWMEVLSEDFCYPDHVLVTPTSIERGESALASWCTTHHSTVYLNGEDVGAKGQRELTPNETTDYTFEVGGERRTFRIEVE